MLLGTDLVEVHVSLKRRLPTYMWEHVRSRFQIRAHRPLAFRGVFASKNLAFQRAPRLRSCGIGRPRPPTWPAIPILLVLAP